MTDSFLPFRHLIDPDRALRILRGATDGADDGEIFLERTRSESLVFDDRRLRNAGYGAAQGFGLRAVRGEVTGYAHSTHIAEDALRDAADTARLAVGAGGGILAPAPAGPGPALYGGIDPVEGIEFAARVATLRDIDAYARDLDPRVVQVTASIADRRGSITVDDEGTAPARNVLIEDGVLLGYLQDRQNARLMGVEPTGNGRRESFSHAPMPRMTNTFMLAGDDDPASILSGLDDGIHAVGFGGGQVDITSGKFVFSCTEAYRVKNGQVGDPIRGATLIGDGATALQHVRAIGNDLKLDPGIGNCGKQGQWVPVGVGLPTIRIGGLTVGGSAA